jgi:hypothetical protein
MTLLGPINLILDTAPGNRLAGLIQLFICLACFVGPFIRRNGWALAAALLAAVWWIFIGVITEGMDV